MPSSQLVSEAVAVGVGANPCPTEGGPMPLRVNLGVGAVEYPSVGEALLRLLELRAGAARGELLEREAQELAALESELQALGAVLPLEAGPDGQLPLAPEPESEKSTGTTRRRAGG